MPQQQPPENRAGATGSGRAVAQLIEKGWTVYDAVGRPVGNVTEIDTARKTLQLDGRPQGFDAFEIPLSMVANTNGENVNLNKIVDARPGELGGMPAFIDPPATTASTSAVAATPTDTTRSRARTRSEPINTRPEPVAASVAASTTPHTAETTTAPVGPGSMRDFSPPYASRHPTMGPEGVTPNWGDENDNHWSASKIAMAGLALGGLAAAAYFMRRRMRRKSAFERFMDMAGDYFDVANQYTDVATEFARNRHPAWWATLAAAALPLAYYAWPSSKPTYTEQARGRADDVTGYLAGLAGSVPWMQDSMSSMADHAWRQMPSMPDFELPSDWQMPKTWRSPTSGWDWSPRPDVAGAVGALAAGALAIYLIRRATSKSATKTRVADVMTRQPRVIQPDATVADAAAIMRRLDVGALPVCDGTRLIGMLTDRDITIRSTADGRDPHLTPVRDVMSPGVAWATEDDPVDEATRIMREHRIRRLPIVDERHSLVGVVSLGDLAVDLRDDDLSGDTLEQISKKTEKPRNW